MQMSEGEQRLIGLVKAIRPFIRPRAEETVDQMINDILAIYPDYSHVTAETHAFHCEYAKQIMAAVLQGIGTKEKETALMP